jgi:hypothetical protein
MNTIVAAVHQRGGNNGRDSARADRLRFAFFVLRAIAYRPTDGDLHARRPYKEEKMTSIFIWSFIGIIIGMIGTAIAISITIFLDRRKR